MTDLSLSLGTILRRSLLGHFSLSDSCVDRHPYPGHLYLDGLCRPDVRFRLLIVGLLVGYFSIVGPHLGRRLCRLIVRADYLLNAYLHTDDRPGSLGSLWCFGPALFPLGDPIVGPFGG